MFCLLPIVHTVIFLLGVKCSSVHANCVPKLNDGGQLNWELGAGVSGTEILTCSEGTRVRLRIVSISVYSEGTFSVKDGSSENDALLAKVTQNDHTFTEPSILQDILSTGSNLRLEYEAASPLSGEPSMDFLWKCEVSGGTTVADYYSSGVELYSITTSDHVRQVFIPRHSSSFLLGVNLGAIGFIGRIRILRGVPSDTCDEREILLDQEVETRESGEPRGPPYGEDIVDGAPSITAGFHGPKLQLVRFQEPPHVVGGTLYTLEVIPRDFTKYKAAFGTSISGDEEVYNDLFLYKSSTFPSDAIFQFDFVTHVPGLGDSMLSFDMTLMDTAYLDKDSLLNQPSLSIHQGTKATLSLNHLAMPIHNVFVIKGNSIVSATLDGQGLIIDAIKPGIDNVELFDEEGNLLASLTVYVTKPIEMTASFQYITPGEWSSPRNFYEDEWANNPQTSFGAITSKIGLFKPLGITFDVHNNGLVILDGLDNDGDGTLSSRSEWTDDPFLMPPPERSHLSYPPNAEDYFVNIYAVRQFNDTSRTGSYGGGGGTSSPRAPGQGRGGAFVKTYKNKTPDSMASTLMHEVAHCLGLAHHKEWSNFPAMALRSTKRNKNLMAVGRTADDNLSPRQWLNIREMARVYVSGQQKREIDNGECNCVAPCACTGSTGCLCGGGDTSEDPIMAFERCSTFGVCLGGVRYDSVLEINSAGFPPPLCAKGPSLQPDICSFERTSQPQSQPTSTPTAFPTVSPTLIPSKIQTQEPTHICLPIQVHLLTDDYPDETTWEIREVATDIVEASGGGYREKKTSYTENRCLDDEKCFVFIIYDKYGDGICCGYGDGSFSVEIADGQVVYQGSEFEESALSPSFGRCTTPLPMPFPSTRPTYLPSYHSSQSPTSKPTKNPSATPSERPTNQPTRSVLTSGPTSNPTSGQPNTCISLELNIKTDEFPEETTWEINDVFTDAIVARGGNYTEQMTNYNEEPCVDKNSCYVLVMYDSFNDGICCEWGEGYFSLRIDDKIVHEDAEFGSESLSNTFGSCEEVCFELKFIMDDWPTDISWNVTDSNNENEVVASGGGYTEKRGEYSENKCFPSTGCYAVNIADSYSDGLCCGYGEGYFSLAVGGTEILVGSDFGASASSRTFGN